MEIIVKASGILRDGEVALDLERGATVRDAIRLLGERYGKEVEDFLFEESGKLNDDVLIFHNGVFVAHADVPLDDGELAFTLEVIGGG
jgi:molybdopterin converting factor small subunit